MSKTAQWLPLVPTVYLPCTYDSPRATTLTKPIVAYDKAELASLLISMCPKSWQDQHDFNQEALPTSVKNLLVVLENIEKIVVNSNAKEKATKQRTEKATGKHKKGKRKGSSSNNYCIPKKVRVKKGCTLCQKHGGTHMTHNTGDCHKYKKDGTLKKGFSGKAAIGQKCNSYDKKENADSFAQFIDHFSKLKKTVKRAQKSL
jgi:hypothetical protein